MKADRLIIAASAFIAVACSKPSLVPEERATLLRVEQLTADTSGLGLQTCGDCPERTQKVVDMRPPPVAKLNSQPVKAVQELPVASAAEHERNTKLLAAIRPLAPLVFEIHFPYARHTLDAAGKAELENVVAALKQQQNINVVVLGRTDPRGPITYNEKLAERRANTVSSALKTAGIKPSRLTIKPAQPCCDGDVAAPEAVQQKLRTATVQIIAKQ